MLLKCTIFALDIKCYGKIEDAVKVCMTFLLLSLMCHCCIFKFTNVVSHVAMLTCISLQVGEQYQMELWEEGGNKEPRYTLTVVDVPHRFAKNGQFAIFIAPQGR